MNKITIEKDGVKETFESVKKAYEKLGAKSVMNNENGIKFIESKGFKVVAYDKENSKTSLSIIEKLIKLVSVIDKEKLATLESEKLDLLKSMNPTLLKKEPQKLESILISLENIEKEIEKVKNPNASKEAVLDYVSKLYDEKEKDEKK